MRTTFINILMEQAKIDDRIFLIVADVGFSVIESFAEAFPKRFINVGIAEQNAIGIASGLALSGKIAYVYGIIPFITGRCYEQIKLDIAYMNANVRIVGVGSGYSYGALGATHHAIDDIAIMRVLPNMGIVSPACLNEAKYLTEYSINYSGSLYIRLARDRGPILNSSNIIFGKFSEIIKGNDFAIIASGAILNDAYDVAKSFIKEGHSVMLLSAHTLKPFDNDHIQKLIEKKMPIISIEEHSIIGGLASVIAEQIAKSGKASKFLSIGIPDKFANYVGGQEFIKNKMGLSNLKQKIGESSCKYRYK
jgi:transketolase